jgi:hypothetical protein
MTQVRNAGTLYFSSTLRAVICRTFTDVSHRHIFSGNFQKGWLQLRRVIAIAELMGLPQTFHTVQLKIASQTPVDDSKLEKAQLWESICAIDRVAGTVFNLPPGTRRSLIGNPPLIVNGEVQARAYLHRLSDIAIKTQELDDMNAIHGCNAELYSTVLDLDSKLRSLGSEVPRSWWTEVADPDFPQPPRLMHFWHHYVAMRVHLPFTMHRDVGEEFLYSRLAGINACRNVADLYRALRRASPSTYFLSRFLDLQTFTAAVVLLLASYQNVSSSINPKGRGKGIDTDAVVVQQVIDLMEEKSGTGRRFNVARHGAKSIRTLRDLLSGDAMPSTPEELTLKVPLLGNIHVRRKQGVQPQDVPHTSQPWLPSSNEFPTNLQEGSAGVSSVLMPDFNTSDPRGQSDWLTYPFSWSIEDNREDLFRDALLAEGVDDFTEMALGFH